MSFTLKLEDFVSHLDQIRREKGEDAYREALKVQLSSFLGTPSGELFIREFLTRMGSPDWVSLEELRQRKPAPQQGPDMAKLIKSVVPGIKTQGQYDLYMLAFQALSELFNQYYSDDPRGVDELRQNLNQILDQAPRVARVVEAAQQIPVEEQSAEVKDFVAPPAQLTEAADQRALLTELSDCLSPSGLNDWYKANRGRLDRIVSKQYRDPLFDAIRAKKAELEQN